MSDFPDHLCGCHISRDETDRVCMALAAQGNEPLFADARPELRGYWESTGYKPVFAWDAEVSLFGTPLPQWHQDFGTCVWQGSGRALQMATYWQLAFGSKVGKKVEIAGEVGYAGSRTTIGRNQVGWGDGSNVSWWCQYCHDYGVLIRGVYGSIDLTRPREDLARNWGSPRSAPPKSLLPYMASFKLEAAFRPQSVDEAADCIAAGYFLSRGSDRATGPVRDANGMAGTVPCGGHCEMIGGVFRDWKGRSCFVECQSWRGTPQAPHGGGPLRLYDGSTKDLPDGWAGIWGDDVNYYIANGDLWAQAPPTTLWQDESAKPSEMG